MSCIPLIIRIQKWLKKKKKASALQLGFPVLLFQYVRLSFNHKSIPGSLSFKCGTSLSAEALPIWYEWYLSNVCFRGWLNTTSLALIATGIVILLSVCEMECLTALFWSVRASTRWIFRVVNSQSRTCPALPTWKGWQDSERGRFCVCSSSRGSSQLRAALKSK